uniref:Ig-like domain-containing protein n=1 Tax=Astatotilapia calliptera TaxID=8154 RepID=A0AAX7T8A7_ASTCA
MNHSFAALGSMNSIKQERAEEAVAERGHINLTCTYDGSIYNIQWYRQYQRSRPEFLLYITEGGSVHRAEKLIQMNISSATVADSAVYFCAVKPTVTGNPESLYKNPSSQQRALTLQLLCSLRQHRHQVDSSIYLINLQRTDDSQTSPTGENI